MHADRTAPSSTIKNIPGLPWYQIKSRKLISSAEPNMMAVVSPTRVAAPCRLEETAIAIIKGTGLVFSFLQISMATGAIIRTVATLSTKAEIMPANRDSETAAHWTLGTLFIIISARRSGIRLSMNSCTRPMVPPIISKTLKSREPMIWETGSIPERMKIAPEARAI